MSIYESENFALTFTNEVPTDLSAFGTNKP